MEEEVKVSKSDTVMKIIGKVFVAIIMVCFYAAICAVVVGGTAVIINWTKNAVVEVYGGSK